MREVEILLPVLDSAKKALDSLRKIKFAGSKKTLDIYFVDPLRTDLKPDSNGRLIRALRLRRKGDRNYLTYKKDNFGEKDIWLYSDEHEVQISSFENGFEILKQLGFEILVEIKSVKHIYENERYEIILEDVDELGLFLEVERKNIADDENVEVVKKEIREFIEALGIKVGQELNIGKPELMLRKKISTSPVR